MKNIFSLAFQGIRRRKRQTLLVVSILTISFAFAVMMISYTSSIAATNLEYRSEVYGTWYGMIPIGYDGDAEFLEGTEGIDEVGVSVSYATVSTSNTSYSIGTIDENFTSMGPTLLEGRLPESSGEIAMEANLLSALGYDYTLDQFIPLEIVFEYETDEGTEYVEVKKVFTLCGVISSYTNIWGLTNVDLNSAVIISEDAESLYAQANNNADGEIDAPVTSYFFTVSDDQADSVKITVNAYLKDTRDVSSEQSIKVNTMVTVTKTEADYNTVYVALIFVVAIIAVIVIYILQMQSEVRRIVRLRSLGGTKGQLRLLIATETLMLTIPSLIIGTLLGSFGIWLLLKLSVFSGSVNVVVSIPMQVLMIAALAWILGIFAVRFVTIQVAFSTPLTGTMGMQVGKKRFYARFQKALILLMATAFCGTVIFTAFILQRPISIYSFFSNSRDYSVGYGESEITTASYKVTDITTDDVINIESVPGIDYVRAFSGLVADLTAGNTSQGMVSMLMIDSSQDWSELFDMTGVDLEAFENGDQILIVTFEDFQLLVDGEEVSMDSASQLEAGEMVTLSAMSDVVTTDDEGNRVTENVAVSTVDAEIAKITPALSSSLHEYMTVRQSIYDPYIIVCSRATVQKLVDSLPEDGSWNYSGSSHLRYDSGGTVGFRQLYAYADETAEYMSTDKTLATLVKNSGLQIWQNEREYNSTTMQSYLQQIIMFSVSGACIALVVLIILSSTIRLETQREKRRYGILQALGMSKRQRNLRLMGTALVRSLASVILGWGAYRLYDFISDLGSVRGGEGNVVITSKSYMSGSAPIVLTFALFAIAFVICYTSKLSLNHYTLMEMLREDR